ncbi:hypothetical protein JL720_244 [Aureococcus anophagefferens]|nr:hypothetical protein JL720_244 [Aureococcus anophagefferens]
MGQAESSTVKSSQDEESIYFQTSLVVEGERLSPIAYYQESADDATSTASSAFFCAEAGSKFEIKVTLARPPPEGVLYGARVYVDSGAPDVVYEACGPGRGSDASAASTTDRSTPDHYFWLGPGETEYVVRGFFANKLESYPFAFGSGGVRPRGAAGAARRAAKRARVDDAAARAANELGCLRLQFAKVTRFVAVDATPGPTAPRRAPLRGAAAELADAKGTHIAAKAGREAEPDAGASALAAEAVLSPKIIHESRLFYNDFAGYRARSSLGKAMLEPLTFQGLPLSCFAQADVRRRCAAKQRAGADVATKKRIWSFGGGGAPAPDAPAANAPVPVADLAKFLCSTISPAASRAVCRGPGDYDGDYGEKYVQVLGDEAHRLQDLAANTAALLDYFAAKPDHYDLAAMDAAAPSGWLGAFQAAAPASYAVSFAVLSIDD